MLNAFPLNIVPGPSDLAAFLIACIIIEITPGPNMGFLSLISATKGRAYGIATVLGITLGLLCIGLAAALGLATLISNSAWAYQALRITGVIYLLWIAFDEWRQSASVVTDSQPQKTHGYLAYFRHGLIVNILNPKAAAFYITVIPRFIDPTGPAAPQAVSLTLISIAIATLIHGLIVGLAGFLKPLLSRAEFTKNVRRLLSVLLAIIAIWVWFST